GVAAQGQLDQHPPQGRGDHHQHLGVLVRPAGGQADEGGGVVAGGAGGGGERLHAPGPDRDLGHELVGRVAEAGREGEADRVAVGDLERVEQDLLDAVVPLDLDGPGEDLLAAAGVDGQAQGGRAAEAGVVEAGDEAGPVPLGQGAGGLEVDEEVL